jgi:hypothetical protein
MVHRMDPAMESEEQSMDVPGCTPDAQALSSVLVGVGFDLLVETKKVVSLLQPDSQSTSCRDTSSVESTCFFGVMTVESVT